MENNKLKDERELIDLAKNGNKDSFNNLVKIYGNQIYNLALRLTGNKELAQDIVQETFINAFLGIKKFKKNSSFGSWLYRIAINCWKNRVRYEKRRLFTKHSSIDDVNDEENKRLKIEIIVNDEIEDIVEKKINVDVVQKVLNMLNKDYKIIIILRDIFEKEYEEIADILNIPIGTVKSRLSRARQELKKLFFSLIGDKNE